MLNEIEGKPPKQLISVKCFTFSLLLFVIKIWVETMDKEKEPPAYQCRVIEMCRAKSTEQLRKISIQLQCFADELESLMRWW